MAKSWMAAVWSRGCGICGAFMSLMLRQKDARHRGNILDEQGCMKLDINLVRRGGLLRHGLSLGPGCRES